MRQERNIYCLAGTEGAEIYLPGCNIRPHFYKEYIVYPGIEKRECSKSCQYLVACSSCQVACGVYVSRISHYKFHDLIIISCSSTLGPLEFAMPVVFYNYRIIIT